MDKNENMELDEKFEEAKIIKGLSTKEIKDLHRAEFQANPDKYYPTKFLAKINFHRNNCVKCGGFFYKHETNTTDMCGDSNCVGKYSFIGTGVGIGAGPDAKHVTYGDAWRIYEKSMNTNRIPSKTIDRYPVVARWRNDVDYVAAGIYCFQPYCVTGEMDPPANPLISPQFCVRFND